MRKLFLPFLTIAAVAIAPASALAVWEPSKRIDNTAFDTPSNPMIGLADDGTSLSLFQQVNTEASLNNERDIAFPYLTRRGPTASSWLAPKLPEGTPRGDEGGDQVVSAKLGVAPSGLGGSFFSFLDTSEITIFGSLWPESSATPNFVATLREKGEETGQGDSDTVRISDTPLDVAVDGGGNFYVVSRNRDCTPAETVLLLDPDNPTCTPKERQTEEPVDPKDGQLFITRVEPSGAIATFNTGLKGRSPQIAVSKGGDIALSYVHEEPLSTAQNPGEAAVTTPTFVDHFFAARGRFGAPLAQSKLPLTPTQGEQDLVIDSNDHDVVIDDSAQATFVFSYRKASTGSTGSARTQVGRTMYARSWPASRADNPFGQTALSKSINRTAAGSEDARTPRVAVDAAGRVTAAWTQTNDGANFAYATELVDGRWKDAARVSSSLTMPVDGSGGSAETDADVVAVAVDRTGVATMLIPGRKDGSRDDVWASRRPSGGAWSEPVRISNEKAGGNARSLHVAARPAGQVDAVWVQDGGVHAARFGTKEAPGGVPPDAPKDKTPPEVTLTSPRYVTDVGNSATFKVNFSGKDKEGGAVSFSLQFRDVSVKAKQRRSKARKSAIPFKTISAKRYAGQSEFTFKGSPGRTYEFRLRGRDEADNRSDYVHSKTVVPLDDTSSRLDFSKGWSLARQAEAYRGRFKVASRRKLAMTFVFTGGQVAIIAPTGPSGGKARVTLDGRSKTIDFYAGRGQDRVVLYRSGSTKSRRHRLKIVVLHKRQRKARGHKVAIDAIAVEGLHR